MVSGWEHLLSSKKRLKMGTTGGRFAKSIIKMVSKSLPRVAFDDDNE